LWKAAHRDEAFQVHQLLEAPFLILSSPRPMGQGERAASALCITRLVDKRTGQEILREEQSQTPVFGCSTVEISPDERIVHVLLPDKTLRLQYAR